MKINVSVIIVNYKVIDFLFDCISSLYESNKGINFEIIVVDNEENKTIELSLLKKFPRVKYIPNKNKGFGQGNNIGTKIARGRYLFFLNPDTIVMPGLLKSLVEFLEDNEEVGVVAPLLLHENKKPFLLQGTKILTPLRVIFGLTFLNRLFPNNPIAKDYWLKDWDKSKPKEVDVVPGTAFMIEKKFFNKIGGFDDKFFLYFEEFDLCKRVVDLGKKLYILPSAKVIHFWGRSTDQEKGIKEIYFKSRFYYFKKNYGLLNAILVSIILGINKLNILIFLTLLTALFLYSYKIWELMPFISDQAWFYLSAQEIILGNSVPLVGIPSSHPWLHQGPLWTYLLVLPLSLFNFNPVSPLILTSFFGAGTVFLTYKIGKDFFNTKLAIISMILMAFSPLLVAHMRMPYHTAPIPFFVLILTYSLICFIRGKGMYFVGVTLSMSILYNFHLGTVIFWLPIFLVLLLGYKRKKKFVSYLRDKKIITMSVATLLIPMTPILIYDFQNGFPQTLKYAAWFGYKFLQAVGIYDKSPLDNTSFQITLDFFVTKFEQLTIPIHKIFTLSAFLVILLVSSFEVLKRGLLSPISVISLITGFGLVSFFVSNVPSEAYLVMLFPGLIFLFSYTISIIKYKSLCYLIVIIIVLVNLFTLYRSNFLTYDGIAIQKLDFAAREIARLSNEPYKIIVVGKDGKKAEYLSNYEYLIWLNGGRLPSESADSVILVKEQNPSIFVEKLVK